MESRYDRWKNPEKQKPWPEILTYILVLILVAVVVIVVLALFGATIGNVFSSGPRTNI